MTATHSQPAAGSGSTPILVIFDCDGVLVDSEVLAHELLAQMLTELGHPMSTGAAVSLFVGRSWSDLSALVEGILGGKVPAQVGDRYSRLLRERLRHELKPVAGVKAAILAMPYGRCVASSSSLQRIRLSLDVTGLAPLFDDNIFSATQVAHGKPAPDLYLFAASAMGAAVESCVVVEDSALGVKAAVAAGMAVVGFAGAGHATLDLGRSLAAAGAAPVIGTMDQLPSAIGALVRFRPET